MVLRTIAGISIQAQVVISPATSTRPVVVAVSQATRAIGSWARIASRTPSEIWSHSLSGCPSVTDSLVKNDFGFFMKSLIMGLISFRYNEKTVTRYKKPPGFRGLRVLRLNSPHLAECSAGIGTLPALGQAGCRASSGRFPPPLLMRAVSASHV